jgi:hypothetical protein
MHRCLEVNNLQILRISNLDLRENHKRRILLAVTFSCIVTCVIKRGKQLSSYFKGAILRFSAGLMPLSSAFLECFMKYLVGEREETL